MCIDLSSPNLDAIKKQARNLLNALQRGDAVAVIATIPLTLLRTCLDQDLKTLST
jgi:hypothetical protein